MILGRLNLPSKWKQVNVEAFTSSTPRADIVKACGDFTGREDDSCKEAGAAESAY